MKSTSGRLKYLSLNLEKYPLQSSEAYSGNQPGKQLALLLAYKRCSIYASQFFFLKKIAMTFFLDSFSFSACVLSCFSCVRLFETLWTTALQDPVSWLLYSFSRQAYWRRQPFPSPGYLPDPGIEPASLMSLVLAGSSLPVAPPDSFSLHIIHEVFTYIQAYPFNCTLHCYSLQILCVFTN